MVVVGAVTTGPLVVAADVGGVTSVVGAAVVEVGEVLVPDVVTTPTAPPMAPPVVVWPPAVVVTRSCRDVVSLLAVLEPVLTCLALSWPQADALTVAVKPKIIAIERINAMTRAGCDLNRCGFIGGRLASFRCLF